MSIKTIDGQAPQIADSAYVDELSGIYGNVVIKEGANIWPMAVLRADLGQIVIGKNSNVQDNATVHVSEGCDTVVGEGVTVGHNAILHGCTIEDNVLVGMGAIVLDNAYIEENCMIGAGAMVTGGKRIPSGSLVLGAPGKVVRPLTDAEIQSIRDNAAEYVHLAEKFK